MKEQDAFPRQVGDPRVVQVASCVARRAPLMPAVADRADEPLQAMGMPPTLRNGRNLPHGRIRLAIYEAEGTSPRSPWAPGIPRPRRGYAA
jgi:hypothetical protein